MCSGKTVRLTISTFSGVLVLAIYSLVTVSAQADIPDISIYSSSGSYSGTQILSPEECNNGTFNCTGDIFYEKDLTRLPPLADIYPLDLVHESFMHELPVNEYTEKLTEIISSVSLGATARGIKALLRYMASGTLNNIPNKIAFLKIARKLPGVLYTRVIEYLYYAGLQEDAIDLIDDTFEINRLVHMQMVIPEASKSMPGSAVNYTRNYFSSPVEHTDNLAVMEKKSATQPYIDITPKWTPKPGFYLNAYLKALISLKHQMPEGSKLRLFPTSTADGQYLTCEVIIMYPDDTGTLRYSQVLEIIRDWGSPDSASWITDRIAQRNLVTQDLISYRDQTLNYLRGSPSSLPAFNPIDAEMIQILADLVKEYLQDPDAQCEFCNNFDFRDYPTPRHVDIKQSGYYMAAVDAGDMVFFVDLFASQNTASPRITMKKVPFDKVDEDIMTKLDSQRIERYPSVMFGLKPFDPVNRQLELAFLKMLVSQSIRAYASGRF